MFIRGFKQVALAGAAVVALGAGTASAQDVTIGFLGAITGPIANLVPPIVDAAQLAVDEVNAAGGILGGQTLDMVVGDTACSAQQAVDAATKVINVDQATAVVGALCSGATIAAASSVAIPAGVVMVSPASTSPEITNLDDGDLVFRTAPSDAYQGQVLASHVMAQGIDTVALTYINNDYGVGLSSSFRDAFVARGGTITADQAHEPAKSSYRSELATLATDGAETLVLIAYAGDSGLTMLRQSLENGFFGTFVGADGMRDDVLIEQLGAENLGGLIVTQPTSLPENPALGMFNTAFADAGGDPTSIFVAQGYDSAMLIALAIEHAGTTDRDAISASLRSVANPPGVEVGPGDWAEAIALIAAGEEIDYTGAAGPHDFDDHGDVAGVIAEYLIEGDTFVEGEIITVE